MSTRKDQNESHEAIEEAVKERLAKPPMYNVVLLNDDYTPMDFVVEILRKFFGMNEDRATDIMLAIHYEGKAKCGTYSAEVAETKVAQVSNFAREHQHPLKCAMEKA